MNERFQQLRLIEAILFASAEPIERASFAARLPENADVDSLLAEIREKYTDRGVNVVVRDGRWAMRTAPDLAPHLQVETEVSRKLSRAAIETLAIIAFHQPVTRAEIEEIRGVQLSKGTLDTLLESGWIRPGRRRRTPGRPVTWMTTPQFLDHFGLESIEDLPGLEELKAAGLLDSRPAIEALGGVGNVPLAGGSTLPPEAGDESEEEGDEDLVYDDEDAPDSAD